jgi:glycine cleavage system H protein
VSYPTDRKYSDQHEWIRVDGNIGTIGITAYAAEQVGDIVFVDLPSEGDKFDAGQPFGVIESVKAVSELFCPVSGTVTEVNSDLASAPEGIASDPHETGWLIRVELSDPAQVDALLDAAAYQAMIDAA